MRLNTRPLSGSRIVDVPASQDGFGSADPQFGARIIHLQVPVGPRD
jgi:hypothetical protein